MVKTIESLAQKIWWKSWAYRKMYPRTLSKRMRIDLISEFLPVNNDMKVLDIGCGAGFISSIYGSCGIDTRLAQLKWAEKEFTNAKFIGASAEKLPFKNQSFDSVLCIEVVEHLDNITEIFYELDRITKEDGLIIISTPSIDGFFKPPRVKEHLKDGFSLKELEIELKKCGITILQVKYYNKFFGYFMWLMFHHAIHNMEKMPSAIKYIISTVQFSPLFPILYSIYKLDLILPGKGVGMIIKARKTQLV